MDITKQDLRKIIRDKRKQINPKGAIVAGGHVLQQLLPILDKLTPESKIAIYHAESGELDLSTVIEYLLSCGHLLYQPIASRNNKILRFERIYNSDKSAIFFAENYEVKDGVECYNLDFMLLPLLAIDKHGHRLGQGGGYYDSTLQNVGKNTVLCGVGYDWQMLENVPDEKHDISLDYFASDKQLYRFREILCSL